MAGLSLNLEKDVEERECAIYDIERVIFTGRYGLSAGHYNILSVQSVAMIYSIWEGFVQNSFRMYADEINGLCLKCADVKDELLIYQMESNFSQFFEYPNKNKKKINFFYRLIKYLDEDKVVLCNAVKTRSNVDFNVLNSLLSSFCIEEFAEHWGRYKFPKMPLDDIMRAFLKYRNGVAHGGDISSEEKVTQEVFQKYKNLVIDLMREIHLRMVFALENKAYLK